MWSQVCKIVVVNIRVCLKMQSFMAERLQTLRIVPQYLFLTHFWAKYSVYHETCLFVQRLPVDRQQRVSRSYLAWDQLGFTVVAFQVVEIKMQICKPDKWFLSLNFLSFQKLPFLVVNLFTEGVIISGKIMKWSQEILIIWQNLDGEW